MMPVRHLKQCLAWNQHSTHKPLVTMEDEVGALVKWSKQAIRADQGAFWLPAKASLPQLPPASQGLP